MKRTFTILMIVVLLLAAAAIACAGEIRQLYRDISFDWKERTQAERTVKAYAEEMGISYGEYPESIIELLERNPEAEEFVLNYPFREELTEETFSVESSGGVPLLMQWDTRWGYIEYGSDVAGITGCGPLCLAMAGSYVTGEDRFSPAAMLQFATDNGYYSPGNGSSWTLISEGGVTLGLDVTEIPLVKKRIFDNLEVGNPIICAMGPGDFTSSGHYIVMVGAVNGQIKINDPNSYKNSAQLWTYEQIESQIRNLWVIR